MSETRRAQLGDLVLAIARQYHTGEDLQAALERLVAPIPVPVPIPDPAPRPVYASASPFAVHEGCLDWIDGVPGWFVDTVHVWQVDRLDYRDVVGRGHTPIARLNNGYGVAGTIPHPDRYQAFADRCGLVVGQSPDLHIEIIGNEPQHPNEWPDGRPITPAMYVDCYRRARAAIHGQAGHENDQVLLAPVAPWSALVTYEGNNREGFGDWVQYAVDVADLAAAAGGFDGFALHTYTRSHNPAEVTSSAPMGPPFGDRHSNFRAYMDILHALWAYEGRPVYITEFCPVEALWQNVNNGLLQAAYAEIARWGSDSGWPIGCLALYRGVDRDRWYFGNRPRVREDMNGAIAQWRTEHA